MEDVNPRRKEGELNVCLEESSEFERAHDSLNELLATIDLKAAQREIEEGLRRERLRHGE